MSENAIAITKSTILQENKYQTDEAALAVTGGGVQYLPYVQLMAPTSSLVTEGKQSVGHFILFQGKQQIDLGKSFDCVCLGWRPRAMSFGENIVSIFDIHNPEFLVIKGKADNRVQGYSYGKEFLLYITSLDLLCVYLFGSLTARLEEPNMTVIYNDQKESDSYIVVNVASQLAGKKNRYPVPAVTKSESVLTKFVSDDKLKAAFDVFNNPKDTEIETVEADTRER